MTKLPPSGDKRIKSAAHYCRYRLALPSPACPLTLVIVSEFAAGQSDDSEQSGVGFDASIVALPGAM